MGWLHLFFGFSGRINRAKYWLLLILWIVFWAIAAIVLIGAVLAILGLNVTDGKLPGPEHAGKFVHMILDYVVLFIVVVGIAIASWVSGFAIGVKRLHDRNKSGWWILVFYVAPSVLGSVAEKGADDTSGAVMELIGLVLWIWGLVELGFLRGTVGPNRFGPDPLQPQIGVGAAPEAPKPAA